MAEKQPKMYGVVCGIITPDTFVRGVVSRLTTKPILHTLVKKILRVTLTSK